MAPSAVSRSSRRPVDAHRPGWLTLTAAILHRAPRLPGALCRDQPWMFDADDAASRDAALRLCQRCPSLPDCRRWVSSLPHAWRPPGVVAGRYRGRVTTDNEGARA
ncbi:hypothetical protein QGN32_20550 [Mycolicibacterium sp. ND9-15]|uniref:hypothetical protein n=1 Tax=Mycolicibacterium sp. ND9-15 TaxID=3042320 RepID=UPI002DDBCB91|nr:hypothetical protein [Mycolicibacterium sp. ND9-15]WSE55758.1 hypothetical protein QGN32_20550 [Mycolicibacterium sp. ND9-15]